MEESSGMLGGMGIQYSTENEKDVESRSVKFSYELKDKAARYTKY